MRIYIVDDHPLLCEGLRKVLERGGHEVVGEEGDGQRALAALVATPPDLAIIDLSLPGLGGEALVDCLRRQLPTLALLVYTADSEPATAARLLRLGVRGYMIKEDTGAQVLMAIEQIRAGQVYVSAALQPTLITALVDGPAGRKAEISPREQEVLLLVGQGLSEEEIAILLGISVNTVGTHRERLKHKLGLAKTRELVAYAALWSAGAKKK